MYSALDLTVWVCAIQKKLMLMLMLKPIFDRYATLVDFLNGTILPVYKDWPLSSLTGSPVSEFSVCL